MFVAAVAFVIYNWRSVWPKVLHYRQEYLDNADDPDKANPALDLFDRYQNESLMIVRNVLFLLAGDYPFQRQHSARVALACIMH